jgi:hypothetical protein
MISHAVMAKPGCSAPSRRASAQDTSWLERHSAWRLDHLAGELEDGVAAAGIDVVVLEEGRRRQHDVGHARGLGHELLVHADEQVVAREARAHLARSGRTTIGLVFWISIAVTGGPSPRSRDRRSAPARCATCRARTERVERRPALDQRASSG